MKTQKPSDNTENNMENETPQKKDDATEAIYLILAVLEGKRVACSKQINVTEFTHTTSAENSGRVKAYEECMGLISGLLPIIDCFVRANASNMDVIEAQFKSIKEQSRELADLRILEPRVGVLEATVSMFMEMMDEPDLDHEYREALQDICGSRVPTLDDGIEAVAAAFKSVDQSHKFDDK